MKGCGGERASDLRWVFGGGTLVELYYVVLADGRGKVL